MWRQGDVFIERVAKIPARAEARPHCVLAEGEVTGHSHRIRESGVARMFAHTSSLYLEVTAEQATIAHEEHGPITLPRGTYRVWQQREYTPQAIRTVRD
jgi:hypothetical protein